MSNLCLGLTCQATGRTVRLGTLSFSSLQLLPAARPGSEACSEKVFYFLQIASAQKVCFFFFFLQVAEVNAVKQSSGTASTFIPVSAYISESISKAAGMSCLYESQAMFPFLPRHAQSGHRDLSWPPPLSSRPLSSLHISSTLTLWNPLGLSRMQDGFSQVRFSPTGQP